MSEEERRILDTTIGDDLPFGGVGHSGIAHYHGYDGCPAFSRQEAGFRHSTIDVMTLGSMFPSYCQKSEKQFGEMTKVRM